MGPGWNYLRVRGEYLTGVNINMLSVELPPRARRILGSSGRQEPIAGTTSACAENTKWFWDHRHCARNYLRVRGEYMRCPLYTCPKPELPPRARRILVRKTQKGHHHGTTSACAENTHSWGFGCRDHWNYLRVRGEYARPRTSWPTPWELPPRARRILGAGVGKRVHMGTTSACAENTYQAAKTPGEQRNYLRVRGEYVA